MLAFVLSGGGNFGALQAGALEVLLERGLRPQMLVGTSAGALNSAILAADPTPGGARYLQSLWHYHGGIPSSPFLPRWRMLTDAPSLYPSKPLFSYFRKAMPEGIETYGDLEERSGVRAYAVAIRLDRGEIRVFGDDPEDKVLDGMMASCAMPLYFPPWVVDGVPYVDGGALAKLPLRIAAERGAEEVFALDVEDTTGEEEARGMWEISAQVLSLVIAQQVKAELRWAREAGLKVHYISLPRGGVPFWDFTRAEELIELGREAARSYLEEMG